MRDAILGGQAYLISGIRFRIGVFTGFFVEHHLNGLRPVNGYTEKNDDDNTSNDYMNNSVHFFPRQRYDDHCED